MSVKLAALAALGLAGQQIVIPFGKPPPPLAPTPPALANMGPKWAATCSDDSGWDDPAPPVRLYGNSYLVGTCGIVAVLVTSPQGHVLIDSGTDKGAAVVAANIVALGFKLRDVRALVHTHEHHDHIGGMSRLRALTGARLLATREAARVFATGKIDAGDPQFGTDGDFEPVTVDGIIADGEQVRVGDSVLTATATPGHTTGALSWSWKSCEATVCKTIVFADSLSPVSADGYRFSDHPEWVKMHRGGIARLAALPACDIIVTGHPVASNLRARLAGTAPLAAADSCKTYAAAKTRQLDERLAKEGAK